MRRLAFGIACALAIILQLIGCQAAPETQKPAHSALTDADLASLSPAAETPSENGKPQTVEQALGSDPCSIRLGGIEEAIVLYFAVNREMPSQLQDLRSVDGGPIQLRCPTSTLPYQFSSSGLVSSGRTMRVLVWDATPVHGGFRWCILMSPSKPGGLALDVKPLPESLFSTYLPIGRQVSPPSP